MNIQQVFSNPSMRRPATYLSLFMACIFYRIRSGRTNLIRHDQNSHACLCRFWGHLKRKKMWTGKRMYGNEPPRQMRVRVCCLLLTFQFLLVEGPNRHGDGGAALLATCEKNYRTHTLCVVCGQRMAQGCKVLEIGSVSGTLLQNISPLQVWPEKPPNFDEPSLRAFRRQRQARKHTEVAAHTEGDHVSNLVVRLDDQKQHTWNAILNRQLCHELSHLWHY